MSDTVPIDRSALLDLLDETFDVIEWLIPRAHLPDQPDLEALEKAHRGVLADFEKWTVDQIEQDLSDHDNVTSIFTKLSFFKE